MTEKLSAALRAFLMNFDPLIAKVAATTRAHHLDEAGCAHDVLAIVDRLNASFREALQGAPLRGARNLLTAQCPFYGYQVRRAVKTTKFIFPREGETLSALTLISGRGAFGMVELYALPGSAPIAERLVTALRACDHTDLRSADLPFLLETAVEAAAKHITTTQRMTQDVQRMRVLVNRVFDAFSLPEGT